MCECNGYCMESWISLTSLLIKVIICIVFRPFMYICCCASLPCIALWVIEFCIGRSSRLIRVLEHSWCLSHHAAVIAEPPLLSQSSGYGMLAGIIHYNFTTCSHWWFCPWTSLSCVNDYDRRTSRGARFTRPLLYPFCIFHHVATPTACSIM